ncbi:hypothetical protein [Flavobacterium sp. UBA4197]|uniref:hypothetical protein n=1 Tax=Flavobacterium sp. UBA4197 TaxID=1946546 RepID=UPI00257C5266|nr:hypothetical protein [Flavobacterium sp. UBA4197]
MAEITINEIGFKQDSPEKLAAVANTPKKYVLFANEINAIVDYLKDLDDSETTEHEKVYRAKLLKLDPDRQGCVPEIFELKNTIGQVTVQQIDSTSWSIMFPNYHKYNTTAIISNLDHQGKAVEITYEANQIRVRNRFDGSDSIENIFEGAYLEVTHFDQITEFPEIPDGGK